MIATVVLIASLAGAPALTKAPELVRSVEAVYPPELLAARVGGEVVLFVDIAATGEVEAVSVARASHPGLVDAALVAATQLEFTPAEVDGAPAAIRIEYRFDFAPPPPPPVVEAPPPVRLRGRIREAGNRKPLAGARVTVDGEASAETAVDGTFELATGALGKVRVRVEALAFEPYEIEEELREGEVLEVRYALLRLERDPYETIVISQGERREVSRVTLSREELTKVPGTFGDPARVVENLPGLGRASGGLGGQLIVRGARPEDTETYFEGVAIPNLYHPSGLVSVINPEFLETVDFFPGGFGPRFGRATAGLVDVRSRDLTCELVRGSAKVDLMDAGAFVCVPMDGWVVAAAARRSYLDALLPPIMRAADPPPGQALFVMAPYYWDYQAKAQLHRGRHSFDAFAFGSYDDTRFLQEGGEDTVSFDADFGTQWHRLMLRHRFRSDRLRVTSAVTPGYYRQKAAFDADTSDSAADSVAQYWGVSWREDLELELHPALTLRGGLDVQLRFADLDVDVNGSLQTRVHPFPTGARDWTDFREHHNSVEDWHHAYWIEADLRPIEGLAVIPGLRVDRFDFHHIQRVAPQPRVTARYEIIEGTTLKSAWGLYEKLPPPTYIIENFGNPFLPPERAQHVVAGVEQQLAENLSVDLSGFYTSRWKLRSPSSETVVRDGRAEAELWDSRGEGESYGLELMVRREPSPRTRFYGWIAYTLSRSTLTDFSVDPSQLTVIVEQGQTAGGPTLERPRTYVSPNDQTHILTVVGQWQLPYAFDVGARLQLSTGTPYTDYSRGDVFYDSDLGWHWNVPGSGPASTRRLPTFHRLDVRVDRTFTFEDWKLTAYLELLNAYNHRAVEDVVYDYRNRTSTSVPGLPILPVLGVRGEL